MRRMWLCIGMLVAGCRPAGHDASMGSAPVSDGLASLDAAARARFAARIDASRLVLGPREVVVQAPAFDAEAALDALHEATGGEFHALWMDGVWRASDGVYQVTFDERSGELDVTSMLDYDASLEPVSDDVYQANASALLGAFAPDMSAELEVQHLGGTTQIITDGEPQNVEERLGSKVFVTRALGGVAVSGSRLVASYLNDGRLCEVNGSWPRIDLARSRLASTLSRDQVVDSALEALLADGVSADGPEPIELESFYELRSEADSWIAVLRASAIVVTSDADGEPGRRERHDFDL